MGLRTRLTAGMIMILLTSFLLSGILIINNSLQAQKKEASEYTVRELKQLQMYLDNSADVTLSAQGSQNDIVKGAIIKYLFRNASAYVGGNSEFVLQTEDSDIVNNSGINAKAVLWNGKDTQKEDSGGQVYACAIIRRGGKDYCIVGCRKDYSEAVYYVSVVRDITDNMSQVRKLAFFCIVLDAVILSFAAAVSFVFIKKALAPLKELEKSASLIAAGEYGRRLGLSRKDEVGTLAQNFDRMAQAVESHITAAEEKVEEQKLLISAISHEMRTPVTAITGYAYALKNGGLKEAQQAEAIDFIDSESRRLERLSTRLTQLILMEHNDLEKDEIDVDELFCEVCRIEEPRLTMKGVKISIKKEGAGQGAPKIIGEKDLLMALLTNLIDNAVKAGSDKIELGFLDRTLYVKDNGRGIPEEEIGKITRPFYKGDVSRNSEGFGLGLTLCQKIAALHGTNLSVHSKEGAGSIFSLELLP